MVRRLRIICGVAAALPLVVMWAVIAPQRVQADVFSPIPSPPVVNITVAPAEIQPQYPDSLGVGESGGVYTLTATIATNATLAALNTVQMCWYRSGEGADDSCATLNPQNAFQMVWTEATAAAASGVNVGKAGFVVSTTDEFASNRYSNVGSQVETTADTASYNKDAQSMTIKFSFRVSSAMLAGSDWAVKVTAVYDDNLCNNEVCPGTTVADTTGSDSESDINVLYWGALTTSRERMGFGVVGENSTSEIRTANSFAFVANAESDYSMIGTDFYYDVNDESAPVTSGENAVDTLTLVAGEGVEAAGLTSKQVRLECKATNPAGPPPPESELEPERFGFVKVDKDGERLGITIPATGETPVDTGAIDCKLSYGGGASEALKIYSSVVTLSILQKLNE